MRTNQTNQTARYVSRPVHRSSLVRALMGVCGYTVPPVTSCPKLPSAMAGQWCNFPLHDSRGNLLALATVRVNPAKHESGRRGENPHRVFAIVQGREIPIGRLAQAKPLDLPHSEKTDPFQSFYQASELHNNGDHDAANLIRKFDTPMD